MVLAKHEICQIITAPDLFDFSSAEYSVDLSSAELDDNSKSFHVTMDRAAFKRILSLVVGVLESNAFVTNIENIIACFDECTIATKVLLHEKQSSHSYQKVKKYLPCIQFKLPSKDKVGPLLKKLYAEINNYEIDLHKVNLDKSENELSRERLCDEIEKLKSEMSKLKDLNSNLSNQVSSLMQAQAISTQSLISQNILPAHLRMARVREINFQERIVLMKAARASIRVPMVMLNALPKYDDSCILHLVDGQVLGAFAYESSDHSWSVMLAEVLSSNNPYCKVKDSNRAIHYIVARNIHESRTILQLQRGSKVIVYLINGIVLKFEMVQESPSWISARNMQEKITLDQLSKNVETELDTVTVNNPGHVED